MRSIEKNRTRHSRPARRRKNPAGGGSNPREARAQDAQTAPLAGQAPQEQRKPREKGREARHEGRTLREAEHAPQQELRTAREKGREAQHEVRTLPKEGRAPRHEGHAPRQEPLPNGHDMAEVFLRQADLLTPAQLAGLDIDLVGAGSLGGAIALGLCKMGCGLLNRVRVSDHDHCSLHNVPTQWFRTDHADALRPKVDALAETVEIVCERKIERFPVRFTGRETRPVGPVVIVAVDSIEERAKIWAGLKERSDVRLLIDARMGAEVVDIHSVVMGKDALGPYEESLHDPSDGFHCPCTGRSIVYTSLGAGAFVCSLFRSFAVGHPFPRHVAFDFANFLVETSLEA